MMAVVGTPEGREALQRWKARQAGESTALEDSFDITNQVELCESIKNPCVEDKALSPPRPSHSRISLIRSLSG
jgi:hypothetical protein